MPIVNDPPVKTMTEYHRRYSKGRLIHRGWEAYCRECSKEIKLPSSVITYEQARQRLLNIGWLPEKIEGYGLSFPEWWVCPCCHSSFLHKKTIDAN